MEVLAQPETVCLGIYILQAAMLGDVPISSVEEAISCIIPPLSWVTKVLVHQPGPAPVRSDSAPIQADVGGTAHRQDAYNGVGWSQTRFSLMWRPVGAWSRRDHLPRQRGRARGSSRAGVGE